MWPFVTNSLCDVVISSIRYSLNGSDSATFELQEDGSIIGHYRATKLPQEDNQWKSSGIEGDPVTLSEGQHTLSLIVTTAGGCGQGDMLSKWSLC